MRIEMRMVARWLMLVVLTAISASCQKERQEPTRQVVVEAPPQPTAAEPAPLAAAATPANAPAAVPAAGCEGEAQGPLHWLHDDYERALLCAKAANLPLVIDMWAPWCHTCLSMKQTVLRDPALAPLAQRFVWLSLDTDRETNAAAIAALPVTVWPTFYVLSPDETVQGRYLGAASVTQLRELLAAAEKAHEVASAADGTLPAELQAVVRGDRAATAGDWPGAAAAYRQALAAAPAEFSRRAEVLVALAAALQRGGDLAGCVALGRAELGATGSSASAADFVQTIARCAAELDEAKQAWAVRRMLVRRLEALLAEKTAPLSADDRADAMRIARELYDALGQHRRARRMAERQAAYLEDAARAAESPYAAMTFNWPRAEVAVYLGRAAELVAPLEAQVAALPTEYDPPYRLAWVLLQLGEHERAQELAERASALMYGPRKARALQMLVDIAVAAGDPQGQRRAFEELIEHLEQLPAGQADAAELTRAREALAALPKTPR